MRIFPPLIAEVLLAMSPDKTPVMIRNYIAGRCSRLVAGIEGYAHYGYL